MTTQTIFSFSGSSLYAPDYAYQPRQLLDWAFIVTPAHCWPHLLQNKSDWQATTPVPDHDVLQSAYHTPLVSPKLSNHQRLIHASTHGTKSASLVSLSSAKTFSVLSSTPLG